jgi:sulfatase maturation enzyme AslB (radical SAM superfamily)
MNILNNITTYTLYLTNNCMLNCPYCYEKKRREKEGLYKMSWEDIQSILDFALKHCPLDKELDISLFGGEPLFYLKD